MSNSVTVTPAGADQLKLIQNLLQLYIYDFSEFVKVERDRDGLFTYPYLDHYWREPDRFPFLISVAGEYAGFALVREELDPNTRETAYDMAEFFVMKMFRRQNTGNQAVQLLLKKLPGNWIVRVLANNQPAYQFWQHALQDFGPHHTLDPATSNHKFTFNNN